MFLILIIEIRVICDLSYPTILCAQNACLDLALHLKHLKYIDLVKDLCFFIFGKYFYKSSASVFS